MAVLHRIGLTHSFDAAHRVVGHQGGKGKCARLHGHTYGVDVVVEAPALDATGFVVDFGEIKDLLNKWDHRTLLWHDDPLWLADDLSSGTQKAYTDALYGVVRLPFNPTAENMAEHLARELYELVGGADTYRGSQQVRVTVTVRETAKSAATHTYPRPATRSCACA